MISNKYVVSCDDYVKGIVTMENINSGWTICSFVAFHWWWVIGDLDNGTE